VLTDFRTTMPQTSMLGYQATSVNVIAPWLMTTLEGSVAKIFKLSKIDHVIAV